MVAQSNIQKKQGPILILLVEDSPTDAYIFQETLNAAKDAELYWVIHVKRVSKALKMLDRDRFDLVVLDLSLPDSTGTETIESIQSKYPELPLLVMSGMEDDSIINEALRMGAQDFIRKGEVESDQLSKAIQFSIQRQKALSRSPLIHRLIDRTRIPGLPITPIFMERLQHCLSHREENRSVALIVMQLGNGEGSHEPIAQTLLWAIARHLAENSGEDDVLTYFGGGVFGLIHENFESIDKLNHHLETLIKTATKPNIVKGQDHSLIVNLGVALCPDDATDVNHLLTVADLALTQAKHLGPNRFSFSSKRLNKNAHQQLVLEHLLERAMEKNEFEIYFQARYDAQNMDIAAIQPLVRWKHSNQNIVPAHEFISIAESAHLMARLNRWVFESSCQTALEWMKDGYGEFKFSFNVSPSQLEDKDFPDFVSSVIRRTKIPERLIYFQIPEAHIAKNEDAALAWINRLSTLNSQIIIDDFGQSTSSLSLLQKLKPSQVNISGGLIRSMLMNGSDRQTVEAIVRSCHSLDVKVAAKSVETEDQLLVLKNLDCDFLQGFYLSEVLSKEGMEDLLASQPLKNPLYYLS